MKTHAAPREKPTPVVPPMRIYVDQAIALTGTSRPTLYKAIASGKLRTVKTGKRRWTTIEWCQQYIDALARDYDPSADAVLQTGRGVAL